MGNLKEWYFFVNTARKLTIIITYKKFDIDSAVHPFVAHSLEISCVLP